MAGWAGLPAAVILVCSTGGATYVANKGGEYVDDGRPAAMTKLGVVTGVVALVFWLWATLLTIFKEFDLGMVSFALAIAASAYGVGVLPAPLSTSTYRIACGVGYGCPAANYLLALALVPDTMLRAYFLMGLTFWLAALYAAFANARDGGLDADAPTTYSPI